MSKNFDLMQEMERNPALHSSRAIERPFPVIGEGLQRNGQSQLANDSTLRLVQQIFQRQDAPRVVVFAGIDHGNGCTEVAASVAETIAANAPRRVCLVEGNFRSPSLPTIMRTTSYPGLSDALIEEGTIRSYLRTVCNENLWLLSAGPLTVDSPNLLSSERMKMRSAELRKEFDFVIYDAPPMTRYADAIALGQLSDGIVLVLEAESTRREAALIAVDHLRSSNVPILGAVLNKRTFPIPNAIYKRL
jgi:capsular exopolysaccharide synthesis family protein